ncbi:hypothetical protein FSP39_005898 [Pinctada imbricata]|uniref:G-protein coupled receptors family 1 profile domain-containing protein n=1 Tax=Pinctada imbricata TaxID=66713 RepID=A0AA88XSN0_PINIB|nr:hypothetical protein FSP39_005898 [Pinctada imbricata]
MQTTTNYFIVNLAVCDIFVTVSCAWVRLVDNLTEGWVLGSFFCKFNSFAQVEKNGTASNVLVSLEEQSEWYLTNIKPFTTLGLDISGTQPSSVILNLKNVILPKSVKVITSKNVPKDVAGWVGYDATGPTFQKFQEMITEIFQCVEETINLSRSNLMSSLQPAEHGLYYARPLFISIYIFVCVAWTPVFYGLVCVWSSNCEEVVLHHNCAFFETSGKSE